MNPNPWRRNVVRLFAIVLTMLIVPINASAEWKEKVLYSFQGGSDGFQPAGGVVFDKSGNLYGATSWGGTICPSPGCGVVFEVSPPSTKGGAWTETTIYVFKGVQGGLGDGLTPVGGLIIDQQGNLYGTTSLGGSGPCILLGSPAGCGTVYKFSPPAKKGMPWKETILYNFQGGTDGYFPWGDLMFDKDGNLYGATQFGGGKGTTCNQFYGGNCGTVFKLSAPAKKSGKWKEKVLHRFAGGSDGANPNGGLIFDGRGSIYGTTFSGGNQSCHYQDETGCGTAFKLSPRAKNGGAWAEARLHVFTGHNDGAQPNGGLVRDSKGSLYGIAGGGNPSGGGIAFQLAASGGGQWRETVLHWFSNKGPGPFTASLLFDSLGDLYGPTADGSASRGAIARLNRPTSEGGKWNAATLYTFMGSPDGTAPAARLIFDALGNLYSATQQGGTGTKCSGGCGSVFRISK